MPYYDNYSDFERDMTDWRSEDERMSSFITILSLGAIAGSGIRFGGASVTVVGGTISLTAINDTLESLIIARGVAATQAMVLTAEEAALAARYQAILEAADAGVGGGGQFIPPNLFGSY